MSGKERRLRPEAVDYEQWERIQAVGNGLVEVTQREVSLLVQALGYIEVAGRVWRTSQVPNIAEYFVPYTERVDGDEYYGRTGKSPLDPDNPYTYNAKCVYDMKSEGHTDGAIGVLLIPEEFICVSPERFEELRRVRLNAESDLLKYEDYFLVKLLQEHPEMFDINDWIPSRWGMELMSPVGQQQYHVRWFYDLQPEGLPSSTLIDIINNDSPTGDILLSIAHYSTSLLELSCSLELLQRDAHFTVLQ